MRLDKLIINAILFILVSFFISSPDGMDSTTYMTGYYIGGLCMFGYFLIDYIFCLGKDD